MAGEWIKLELSTCDKPELFKMARILQIDRDLVLGLLIRFWAWFDKNSVDGHVDGIVVDDLDGVVAHKGFCNAMIDVGWLKFDDIKQFVELPNFSRHNGQTAKTRALKNDRQARWRNNSVDILTSTKTSTREEKRREDIYIPAINKSLLNDYLVIRKAKKAGKLTETSFNAIKKEADKVGLTIEEAISYCCKKTWVGFEASWYLKENPKKANGVVL